MRNHKRNRIVSQVIRNNGSENINGWRVIIMCEIRKKTNYQLPSGTRFVAGGETWRVKSLNKKSYSEAENKYEAESNGRTSEFRQKDILNKLT